MGCSNPGPCEGSHEWICESDVPRAGLDVDGSYDAFLGVGCEDGRGVEGGEAVKKSGFGYGCGEING